MFGASLEYVCGKSARSGWVGTEAMSGRGVPTVHANGVHDHIWRAGWFPEQVSRSAAPSAERGGATLMKRQSVKPERERPECTLWNPIPGALRKGATLMKR